ncbi:unnamed protein product, partial [Oikopleura dioica]
MYPEGIPTRFLKDKEQSFPANTCSKCGNLFPQLNRHNKRKKHAFNWTNLKEKKETLCKLSLCSSCTPILGLCRECDASISHGSINIKLMPTNLKKLVFICPKAENCDQLLTYDQFLKHEHFWTGFNKLPKKQKSESVFDREIEKLEKLRIVETNVAENIQFKEKRMTEIDRKMGENTKIISQKLEKMKSLENEISELEINNVTIATEKENLKSQIEKLKEEAEKLT